MGNPKDFRHVHLEVCDVTKKEKCKLVYPQCSEEQLNAKKAKEGEGASGSEGGEEA